MIFFLIVPTWARGWRLSGKKGTTQKIVWYPAQKIPSLGLVRATPWADFAVITNQLWSTITAIFPCVTLSWRFGSFLRIFVIYCQPQKRPTIWIWVQLLENLAISNPNIDFLYQRISQSWFAATLSLEHALPQLPITFELGKVIVKSVCKLSWAGSTRSSNQTKSSSASWTRFGGKASLDESVRVGASWSELGRVWAKEHWSCLAQLEYPKPRCWW